VCVCVCVCVSMFNGVNMENVPCFRGDKLTLLKHISMKAS